MQKLAIAATAAAFLVTGLVIASQVLAQGYVNPPIGEKGAKWGNQCWIGETYQGYWGACPKPKAAPKATKAPKGVGTQAAPK
jgi:hypothetical protein